MRYKYQKRTKKVRPIRFEKKNAIWLLVFMLFSLQVFFAVQTSSAGADISNIEEEVGRLQKENEELSIKLISSTSLTKLSQESEKLGFKKYENTLYLQKIDSFAKAN